MTTDQESRSDTPPNSRMQRTAWLAGGVLPRTRSWLAFGSLRLYSLRRSGMLVRFHGEPDAAAAEAKAVEPARSAVRAAPPPHRGAQATERPAPTQPPLGRKRRRAAGPHDPTARIARSPPFRPYLPLPISSRNAAAQASGAFQLMAISLVDQLSMWSTKHFWGEQPGRPTCLA